MCAEGYITINRKITDWRWYLDIPVKVLFIHMIIKANHAGKMWKGMYIERGTFITSSEHLAEECGLSRQQVRTALDKLKKGDEFGNPEIIVESKDGKFGYTKITINNYCKYQPSRDNDNQLSTSYQPVNNQLTTSYQPELNNDNNDNNDKKINIKKSKEEREREFIDKVLTYQSKYDRQMLQSFINYWTQMNDKGSKMLFEMQKAFEVGKRLSTWYSKSYNHSQSNGTYRRNTSTVAERANNIASSIATTLNTDGY